MPHGGVRGPFGEPRPLCTCEQQVVFELEGRGEEDVDEQSIEDEIDSNIRTDVNVKTRPGRFEAGDELLVILGGSIVDDEVFNDVERIVNSTLFQQNSNFQVVGWRIEGT